MTISILIPRKFSCGHCGVEAAGSISIYDMTAPPPGWCLYVLDRVPGDTNIRPKAYYLYACGEVCLGEIISRNVTADALTRILRSGGFR